MALQLNLNFNCQYIRYSEILEIKLSTAAAEDKTKAIEVIT